MTLRTFRLTAWALAALAAALLTALLLQRNLQPAAPTVTEETVRIGGPFSMTAHDGKAVTEKDFAGKPWLLFVGFTHCPDVCPTTLAEMSSWLEELGSDGDRLQGMLVSVDPERDTVEGLRDYMSAFDPRIVALRPAPAELKRFAKAYRIHYAKVPTGDGDYTMDHTAGVLMFDRDGRFAGTVDMHEPRATVMAKIRRLIGET